MFRLVLFIGRGNVALEKGYKQVSKFFLSNLHFSYTSLYVRIFKSTFPISFTALFQTIAFQEQLQLIYTFQGYS